MNEQIDKFINPMKNFWGNQSKKKKGFFIGGLVGIGLIAAAIIVVMNTKQYVTLFSGVSPEEAAQVVASLGASGTTYQVKDGGTTILVDKQEEPLVRMQMATEGYPKTAPNYNFFKDNIDFMTTESSARTITLYQLEEKTKQTIKTITGVADAAVTINSPDDNGWAWEEDKLEASASVHLTLKPGVSLEAIQVSGIKNLVSSSIPGMPLDSVVVTDQTGAELMSADKMGFVDVNNMKQDIEKQYEAKHRRSIMAALTTVFGEGNVTAGANIKLNLDKTKIESIQFTPNTEGGDKGVISDEKTSTESATGSEPTGGTPGVDENADVPPTYAGDDVAGQNDVYVKDTAEYKYLVNKVTEQIDKEAALVEDLTVGVQINSRAKLLTEAEVENYKQLIASITGTTADKVVVINPEFAVPAVIPDIPSNGILDNKILIYSVSGGVILLFVSLLVVLAINKKLKKKKLAEAQAAIAAENAANAESVMNGLNFAVTPEAMPDLENELMNAPESKENVLRKEIQEFSTKNPEIVAQLLRTWLRGDDGEDA